MVLLILGLSLWCVLHLMPSVAPGTKQALVDKVGFNAYRGVFSLAMLSALALIVFGWRASIPSTVYLPTAELRPLGLGLMVVAFLCLGASQRPTRIGRIIRHPQLTGLLLWSVSHLLTNGDTRSLLLFTTMGTWAVLEMILISRREGAWVKPEAPGWGKETLGIAITLVVMALVMWGHPWLAGMPIF